MAPASKKRVEASAHAGTLHHFFSKSSKSSGSKGQNPTAKPQTSASFRAQAKARAAKFIPPADNEVIVIDSDEGEDIPPKPKRTVAKRKAADDSSDVEVVEDSASVKKVKEDSATRTVRDQRPLRPQLSASLGQPSVLLTPSVLEPWRMPEAPVFNFPEEESWGIPTLLPRSPSPPTVRAPGRATEESPDPPFQNEATLPSCPSPAVLRQSPSDGVHTSLPDDVIEIDDEWGTGDDELARGDGGTSVFDLSDDEVEDADAGFPIDTSSSSLESCPICGKLLKALQALEIQEHVNSCADSQAPQPQPGPSTSKAKTNANAFSVLMSSHKENEAWKEASIAEDRGFRPTKSNGGRRKAPFYKVMTGMPIAVDAFRYGTIPGVAAYFLTHAHSDHYTNLSSNWKAGPIYCSEGTANLIIHMLAVDRKWVYPLPMDIPTIIPNTGGVTVTLIEANHCPGSSLFFFEGLQTINAGDSTYTSPFVGSSRTFRYLHCGDFRASPQHTLHPAVKGKRIDCVYLDTTYLNPKYTFPAQAQVIAACAELAKRLVSGQSLGPLQGDKGKTLSVDQFFSIVPKTEDKGDVKLTKMLVLVGTYSIGKERVVKAVAKALNTKVYCDSRKAAILRCQDDPELHAMLTKDPFAAGVHLVPLSVITSDRIKDYTDRWKGHWSKAVGFRPTGWTYAPAAGAETLPSVASIVSRTPHREFTHAHLRPMRNSTGAHQLFGVPYSEHSSFFELTCFALSVDWARIVATVNVGSEASRGKIAAWVARWDAERKKRGLGVVPYRTLEYW